MISYSHEKWAGIRGWVEGAGTDPTEKGGRWPSLDSDVAQEAGAGVVRETSGAVLPRTQSPGRLGGTLGSAS